MFLNYSCQSQEKIILISKKRMRHEITKRNETGKTDLVNVLGACQVFS